MTTNWATIRYPLLPPCWPCSHMSRTRDRRRKPRHVKGNEMLEFSFLYAFHLVLSSYSSTLNETVPVSAPHDISPVSSLQRDPSQDLEIAQEAAPAASAFNRRQIILLSIALLIPVYFETLDYTGGRFKNTCIRSMLISTVVVATAQTHIAVCGHTTFVSYTFAHRYSSPRLTDLTFKGTVHSDTAPGPCQDSY